MVQINSTYPPMFLRIERLVETYLNLYKHSCIDFNSTEHNDSDQLYEDSVSLSQYPSNATMKAIKKLVIHHVLNIKETQTSQNA